MTFARRVHVVNCRTIFPVPSFQLFLSSGPTRIFNDHLKYIKFLTYIFFSITIHHDNKNQSHWVSIWLKLEICDQVTKWLKVTAHGTTEVKKRNIHTLLLLVCISIVIVGISMCILYKVITTIWHKNPLLNVYSKKMKSVCWRNPCVSMPIVALLIVTN